MNGERVFRAGDIVSYFKRETVPYNSNRFLYRVIAEAESAENGEKMMVYQALYGDMGVYVLPYKEFLRKVNKRRYPRIKQEYLFEKLESRAPLIEPILMPSGKKDPAESRDTFGQQDRLTGLPNLNAFEAGCEQRRKMGREQRLNALALVMIDNYNELKKHYSINVMDSIVIRIADKISSAISDDMELARYGESSFIICCHNLSSMEEAKSFFRHMESTACLTVGDSGAVTVSIGVAQCRHHPRLGYKSVIEKARHALYTAQERGGAQAVYFVEPEDISGPLEDGNIELPPERDIYIYIYISVPSAISASS